MLTSKDLNRIRGSLYSSSHSDSTPNTPTNVTQVTANFNKLSKTESMANGLQIGSVNLANSTKHVLDDQPPLSRHLPQLDKNYI